jgi:ferritin-like metal-binding protein YciE
MEGATLHDRYMDELNDLYSPEYSLLDAPPQRTKAVPAVQSGEAFTDPLKETTAADVRSS